MVKKEEACVALQNISEHRLSTQKKTGLIMGICL
jgi:hypothetical protein